MDNNCTTYPGGSKSKVNKAGENVRNGFIRRNDLEIIEEWRAAHRWILNTFQATLRNRTKGLPITVAQRHKRRSTIFNKLKRYPEMQLSRMDDVAGCRLIFNSIEELKHFRDNFIETSRFKHKLKNDIHKYDYIDKPKETGYRGIHDVYIYDVNSELGKKYNGLYIEIQYRTLIQHAWATAVEIVGFITENKPKFDEGDHRHIKEMAYASEIIARAHENMNGPFPDLSNTEVINKFQKLDNEIGILKKLKSINQAKDSIDTLEDNTILIISPDGNLSIKTFRYATNALKKLFELETKYPEKDIVLVRASKKEDVRLAFKNYFSDAKDFIKLVESGLKKLSK